MGIIGNGINELRETIMQLADKPVTKAAIQSVPTVVGLFNPVAGAVTDISVNFMQQYYDFQLQTILAGLSTGLNKEKFSNELYVYITNNDETAYNVASTFKKALSAECPKALFILGLILGKNMKNNTNYTRDQLIVCKAVESANDYDLKNFQLIMDNCKIDLDNGKRAIDLTIIDEQEVREECEVTCSWAVYNRLFYNIPFDGDYGEDNDESQNEGEYYIAKPAEILLELINEAGPIMDYITDKHNK